MNAVAVTFQGVARPPWERACVRFCRKLLRRLGKDRWEVSLLFCDDRTMRDLNARYRSLDRPTDVLSFSQAEGIGPPRAAGPVTAGDVAISLDRLRVNSQNYCVSLNEELKRLLVHGFLHLAGYDHPTDAPSEPMLLEQEAVLLDLKKERII